MKFGELRSIGHNVATSLASGINPLIGFAPTNVFVELCRSAEGFLLVDFLAGTSAGAAVSPELTHAIAAYRYGLADLCHKHGTTTAAFQALVARYSLDPRGTSADRHGSLRFDVTVEDARGRRATDSYAGPEGRRLRVVGGLGRVRRA